MAEINHVDHLKLMLNIEPTDNSEDALLNLYFSRASNYIKNECNLKELEQNHLELAEDIAIYLYRFKGVENMAAESKGSLSETYATEFPEHITSRIKANKRLRFV